MENLLIEIPEEVIAHLRLPPRSLKQELKKELAVHLYAEGLLPEASACRLAGMTRLAFTQLLAGWSPRLPTESALPPDN